MEQLFQQVVENLRAMWRWRWVGLGVAWVAAIVAAAMLTLVKDRYEASARVYVDTKTVLRPLMHELTVELDLDQTVGLLARTLINRPNVELLMTRTGIEKPTMTAIERSATIERLMREIKLNAVGRDNVYTFSYRDTDPEKARLIVENLVALFLESDTGSKRRDAEAARSFIDEQIKSYEVRLQEAEGRLKDFKLRHLGTTDSTGKDYFQRMSALTDEINKLSVELKAAEQSKEALKRELSGDIVSLLPDLPTAATPVSVPEFDARLEAQRRQLDELLRRYTEQHPDVISTKRLIVRLEEERDRVLELRRQAAAGRPAGPAAGGTQAVQQQIKLALAEAEANVASLRSRVADMNGKMAELRASASRIPQIEAEYTQLNRDYEIVKNTYQTMVARREKAALSEDVDATRASQFRVIDPPRTLPNPVFPNRVGLAPLVLVFALLAGVASTFLMTQLVPTIESAQALRQLTQRRVLGSVSSLETPDLRRRARRGLVGFGTACGGLIVVAGGWIGWVAMQARI